MPTIYRSPKRVVVVKGRVLPAVYSCRTTRGWDQRIATADLVVKWPLPAFVRHRSMIWIYMGADTIKLRFVGYITNIGHVLSPGRVTLSCEDVLCLAKYNKTLATYSLAGFTDEDAVRFILDTIGMPRYDPANIRGTGKVIGTDSGNPALTWQPTESGLSKIEQIDATSIYDIESGARKGSYRTFADIGGNVYRIPLDPMPSTVAARSFIEGVDLRAGDAAIEAVEPTTTSMAVGYGGISYTSTPTSNPWAVIPNSARKRYPTVEEVAASSGKHNLEDIAEFLNQQRSYNMQRVGFVTPREDVIAAHETQYVESDHVAWKGNGLLQSVVTDQNEQGGFSQQVQVISYRELNTYEGPDGQGPPGEDNPFTGAEIPPEDPPSQPGPTTDDVIASFTVKIIDAETVLVGGAYATMMTVALEDTSSSGTGEIVSRTWTITGGTPTTGTDPTFNPNFTDFDTATVQLDVVDANGNEGSTGAKPLSGEIGAPTQQRQLYVPEGNKIAAFNGSAWATAASSASIATANGAVWAAADSVLTSADDLATGPLSSVPFPGSTVESVWIELDVSKTAVAAGGTLGRVALSSDFGATWTLCSPLPNVSDPVIQVIISRGNAAQIWALQQSAINVSDDSGATWRVLRAAAPGQVFTCLRLTNFRNVVASTGGPSPLERAEDPGDPFTVPTGVTAIYGVAANIYEDELTAVTSDLPPRLLVTAAVGSWELVDAETPDLSAWAGAAAWPNCLQQDSGIGRMAYMGAGDWALKTTDWWKPDTIFALRHVNEVDAGSGPIRQVGVGEFKDPAAAPVLAGGVVYIGSPPHGIYRLNEDGETFSLVHASSGSTGLIGGVGSGATATLYTADAVSAGGVNTQHVFYRSDDGGTTWTAVAGRPFDPGEFGIGRFVVMDPLTIVVGRADGLFAVTTDGGATWAPITPGTLSPNLTKGATKIWSAAPDAPYSDVYRFLADGTGLETIGTPDNMVDVHGTTDTIGLGLQNAIDPNGIIVLINGTTATTVTPPGTPAGWFLQDAASPDGSLIVALYADFNIIDDFHGRLYRSTDGGANWTMVLDSADLNPKYGRVGTLAVSPTDANYWWCIGGAWLDIGGHSGADAAVWKSTDGGATWSSFLVATGERDPLQLLILGA